jgi:tetraacyldisaccharide 4'-kinase
MTMRSEAMDVVEAVLHLMNAAEEARNSKIQQPKSKILLPLAALFRRGVRFRDIAYARGWLKTRRLDRPVVSVGNLSVGGTGKTPLVMLIAKLLSQRGWNPAILTRGYGRRREGRTVVLAPAAGRSPDPCEVGDEPALMARALPEVPIVVCADRYRGGRRAEDCFNVGAHLVDDGFQHRALARDVDVVALDTTQELSEQALLPAGRLREPPAALGRAHLVVLTRVELRDPRPLEGQVGRINPRAEIFHAATRLCELVDVRTGRTYPPDAFQGEPIEAFCGIGNPGAFFADLRKWGFSVIGEHSFRDHYVYTDAGLEALKVLARRSHPSALVTTEKDAMNLQSLNRGAEVPILACVIRTELLDQRAFEEALLTRLEVTGTRRGG